MALHQRTHPSLDVAGCFGCRVTSVGIAPSATGSVRAQAANETDKRLSRDMPAYQRLKASGVQPRRIDGCARLEATATTASQVERG